MTLQEAIEILLEEVKHPYSAKKMCRPDAIKLGIEALRREQKRRHFFVPNVMNILPGETKE